MNVELVEVYRERTNKFCLRKIYINPKHVVCMRYDETMKSRLNEGNLPHDLDTRQGCTKLYINRGQSGLDVTVVGEPTVIQSKIDEVNRKDKTLLRG